MWSIIVPLLVPPSIVSEWILMATIFLCKLNLSVFLSRTGMEILAVLFKETIKGNIAYDPENSTDDYIIKVAKLAYADHFIKTLPHGYDTIIDEEASNLSQGQKQLMTIARAILSQPSILILDEATSSVDTRKEIHIQKAMLTLMEGKTSFVIAHRLSTIQGADLIMVMDKGDIIEKGNHKELLQKKWFLC